MSDSWIMTSLPSCPVPVLDGTAALAQLGGNADLLRELAGMFLEECPKRLEEMNEHLRREDARSLSFAAHRFRGSLSCFRAPCAGERAYMLELSADAGDLAAAARDLAALESAVLRLTPALAALVTTGPDRPSSGIGDES